MVMMAVDIGRLHIHPMLLDFTFLAGVMAIDRNHTAKDSVALDKRSCYSHSNSHSDYQTREASTSTCSLEYKC